MIYESDNDTLQATLNTMLDTLNKTVQSSFSDLDNRVESLEKQMATLVLAYGEQAVFMEALISQISFASEQAQQSFHETLKEARKSMLEVMKDGAQNLVAPSDPVVGQAIVNMASEKLSDINK
jgi:polyhydroxyalkanoate synthesis regulator phasin